VIRDIPNKNGWKLCGFAKRSSSHKSINFYCRGGVFVLDSEDLQKLIAGDYDSVEIFEHI
jgi:hypothetical protein